MLRTERDTTTTALRTRARGIELSRASDRVLESLRRSARRNSRVCSAPRGRTHRSGHERACQAPRSGLVGSCDKPHPEARSKAKSGAARAPAPLREPWRSNGQRHEPRDPGGRKRPRPRRAGRRLTALEKPIRSTRPVGEERFSDDPASRDRSPEPAVVEKVTVVTHHK